MDASLISQAIIQHQAEPIMAAGGSPIRRLHKRKADRPARARLDEDTSPEPEPKLQHLAGGHKAATAGGRGPVGVRLAKVAADGSRPSKSCATCGTHSTPMWRVVNSQTFCNACGLRAKRKMGLL